MSSDDEDRWFPKNEAACNPSNNGGHILTALFFSDWPKEKEQAVEICQSCAVQSECLQGALSRRERWGIWGGMELREGRAYRLGEKKRPGRPPKSAG